MPFCLYDRDQPTSIGVYRESFRYRANGRDKDIGECTRDKNGHPILQISADPSFA